MPEINPQIIEEYKIKREKANIKRNEKIDEVYGKFPRIKEIDEKVNDLGKEMLKKILNNPENHEKYNKELNKNLDILEKERNKIIKENNISPDFKKYEYECEDCSDTGYLKDGSMCKCLKQRLINEAYSSSNIEELMKKNNFDNFNFEYYSKEKGKYKDSPFNNITRIYNRTKNFCENFDENSKGLLFYGTTGLGKTFLSCAAAKELIDKGKTVIYIRSSKLFGMLEDYKFGRIKEKNLIDDIYECDLLIIDDLGSEAINKNNNSFLFDVLDERISKNKKIIINTNLDIKELGKIYTMRFVSRIMENFVICNFYGDDIRYKLMGE